MSINTRNTPTWRHGLSVALCLALVCLSAPAFAKVKVVTTLPDFAALAKAVGQSHVEVQALVRSTEDPHYVDARPSYILKLNRAQLLIANGMQLESGWLPPLVIKARNANIRVGASGYLDASTVIKPLQANRVVDRANGDIHPGGNPHFTFDPRQMRNVTIAIAKKLSAIDPEHKAAYEANAKKYVAKLDAFAAKQAKRFAGLTAAQRNIVNYHDSLVYLNNWLALKKIATVEPKPGIAPSPGHVAKVFKAMKATKTQLIVQEVFYQYKTSSTLAKLTKGKVVRLAGGAKVLTGAGYLSHLQAISDTLYNALKSS